MLDPDDVVRPEQVSGKRSFWSQPWPRIVAIGIPSAAILSVLLSFISGNKPPVRDSSATINSSPTATEEDGSPKRLQSLEKELEDSKTKNALQTQANSLKQQEAAPTRGATRPNLSPTPLAVKSLPPRPVRVTRSPIVLPPPVARFPVLKPTSLKRAGRPFTPLVKPATTHPATSRRDPIEQWLAAANLGSYGSLSPSSSELTEANYSAEGDTSEWQVSGGLGTAPASVNSSPIVQASYAPETESQPDSYSQTSGSEILVGTRASAELETPIAWTGQLQNPSQKFLIRLGEPLKGSDGQVVIPEGSYLSASVLEASDAGLLQMEASAVLVSQSGRAREKAIPPGSILILGKGGGILQAEAQSQNSIGSDLASLILSGVSNAAGLFNRPKSESFTNFGGSVDYGRGDYLAGFVQGATQSAVQSMQQRNQQARAALQSQPTVFVLDQGAKVQIYVNQSFSF